MHKLEGYARSGSWGRMVHLGDMALRVAVMLSIVVQECGQPVDFCVVSIGKCRRRERAVLAQDLIHVPIR